MQSANPVVRMLRREKREEMGKPLPRICRNLTTQEVLSYFNNCSTYLISDSVAVRPKGGELFLYSLSQGNKGTNSTAKAN